MIENAIPAGIQGPHRLTLSILSLALLELEKRRAN